MKLFVGLDVSSEKLDACFMTDDSTCSVLKPFIDYSEIAWVLWDIPESRCLTTASHNRVSFIKPLVLKN
jgi:hypothetical protein